jgi:hypothetical protein
MPPREYEVRQDCLFGPGIDEEDGFDIEEVSYDAMERLACDIYHSRDEEVEHEREMKLNAELNASLKSEENVKMRKALTEISEHSCMCSSNDADGEGKFPPCHPCIARRALEKVRVGHTGTNENGPCDCGCGGLP